jgi:hypothetical protein
VGRAVPRGGSRLRGEVHCEDRAPSLPLPEMRLREAEVAPPMVLCMLWPKEHTPGPSLSSSSPLWGMPSGSAIVPGERRAAQSADERPDRVNRIHAFVHAPPL